MNTLKLSKNKQLGYDNTIILEYYIKITKTQYTNKSTNKTYIRHKIKVPGELRKVMENEDYLFFSTIDEDIHITTVEPLPVIHKAKIQKYTHNKQVEFSLNLSKKVFDLSDGDFFYWKVTIEDNTVIDSIAEVVDGDMILKEV